MSMEPSRMRPHRAPWPPAVGSTDTDRPPDFGLPTPEPRETNGVLLQHLGRQRPPSRTRPGLLLVHLELPALDFSSVPLAPLPTWLQFSSLKHPGHTRSFLSWPFLLPRPPWLLLTAPVRAKRPPLYILHDPSVSSSGLRSPPRLPASSALWSSSLSIVCWLLHPSACPSRTAAPGGRPRPAFTAGCRG